MQAINEVSCQGNDTNIFVTLFLGVLDLHTGVLHYCNAGHNSPLIIGHNVSLLPCDPNLPIGIESVWQFSCQKTKLDSQTTIFLFTDGLNEAEDIGHAQFGDQRIVRVVEKLLASQNIQPTDIVNHMAEAVHNFIDGAEQSDDLTMLAIKYKHGSI